MTSPGAWSPLPGPDGRPGSTSWAARCWQEDGFRDHKQRLGMAECRTWTKAPILRTFQIQLVALSLLRLLHARLDETCGACSGGTGRSFLKV
jgi:hypothetical protein